MQCGILPPRPEELMVQCDNDDEDFSCVRERHQDGTHVFKTSRGDFFAWEDDWECDCCEPDEYDRCYTYWEIEEKDIEDPHKKQA